MVDACGTKCAKYTLVTFNLIFFMCGLAVLGVGIWMLVDKSTFVTLTARIPETNVDLDKYRSADTVSQQAAYLLIASGVIVFFVAFLGCCGALKEWRPLLVTYAVFLLIVLGLEIAAGIYAGVYRNTANDYLSTTMRLTLQRQYQHDGLIINGLQASTAKNINFWTNAWDQMMIQLQCCGINNGTDFLYGSPYALEKYLPAVKDAPISCCKFSNLNTMTLLSSTCVDKSRSQVEFSNFNMGCLNRMKVWLDQNLQILIGVGIGIGLVQIFGIVFAFCLCMAIQSEKVA